jgi:hypothetical protein
MLQNLRGLKKRWEKLMNYSRYGGEFILNLVVVTKSSESLKWLVMGVRKKCKALDSGHEIYTNSCATYYIVACELWPGSSILGLGSFESPILGFFLKILGWEIHHRWVEIQQLSWAYELLSLIMVTEKLKGFGIINCGTYGGGT